MPPEIINKVGSDSGGGTDSLWTPLVKSLVPTSWWRLGDLSGTTAVDAMGVANGTYSGGVTLNQPGLTPSTDRAALFDGITGNMDLNDNVAYAFDSTSVTVGVLISGVVVGVSQNVFTKGGGSASNPGLALQVKADGTAAWRASDGTTFYSLTVSSPVVANSGKHLLVGVVDRPANLLLLYVDGALVGTLSIAGAGSFTSPNHLRIGSSSSASFLSGIIDEPFVIMGAAISAQKVVDLWRACTMTGYVNLEDQGTATALETTATSAVVADADVLVGTENQDAATSWSATAAGAGSDSATLGASNPVTESGALTDDVSVLYALTASEAASGADAAGADTTAPASSPTDSGHSIDDYRSRILAGLPDVYYSLNSAGSTETDVAHPAEAAGTYFGSPALVGSLIQAGDGAHSFVTASHQYFEAPERAGFELGTASAAIEFWFSNAVSAASRFFVWHGGDLGTAAGFAVGLLTAGQIWVQVSDGSSASTGRKNVIGPTVTDGHLHHCVVLIDRAAALVQIYLDTVVVASVSIAGMGSFTNASLPMRVGRGISSLYDMTAVIDEVAIYKRLLDPVWEIPAHYNDGRYVLSAQVGIAVVGSGGSASETASPPAAAISTSASGSGTETTGIAVSAADSGLGVASSPFLAFAVADSGHGTSSAFLPTDELKLAGDTGHGSDTVAGIITPTASDSGHGVDAGLLLESTSPSDSGQPAATLATLEALLSPQDNGNGAAAVHTLDKGDPSDVPLTYPGHLLYPVQDQDGNFYSNATVYVVHRDTGQIVPNPSGGAIEGLMYQDAAKEQIAVNPLVSNPRGFIEAWLDTPQSVDLIVTDNSGTATQVGKFNRRGFQSYVIKIEIYPAPEDLVLRT